MMHKWTKKADIARIRRVRAREIAKRKAEDNAPVPEFTKVELPIEERLGVKHDALDPEVPRETPKSTVEHEGYKYEVADGGGFVRTEVKPKVKPKRKTAKKKDKKKR